MIYFCADDYGLCDTASMHIKQCIDAGALNKVSVFPNIAEVNLDNLLKNKNTAVGLHLNLVEGKCMANAAELNLIADEKGRFKHTFIGLLKLNLLSKKAFEAQVYKEVKAQVLFWKSILPDGAPFFIDSHQHTHMIPAVFKAILMVLKEEEIDLQYMRIPVEPLSPYITTPSLYCTYSAVNVIKQWLLNFLWLINKKTAKQHRVSAAYFMGILFSGKMDERVGKILPKYVKLAEKNGRDIEVLFHPGYLVDKDADFESKGIVFDGFYLSENRKTEFDTAMKLSQNDA